MNIILQLILLAVGFVMLVKGSDWFVDGAAGIAAKFRIPQIIIGLTIVAMGTSAPEAAVSITAAMGACGSVMVYTSSPQATMARPLLSVPMNCVAALSIGSS